MTLNNTHESWYRIGNEFYPSQESMGKYYTSDWVTVGINASGVRCCRTVNLESYKHLVTDPLTISILNQIFHQWYPDYYTGQNRS